MSDDSSPNTMRPVQSTTTIPSFRFLLPTLIASNAPLCPAIPPRPTSSRTSGDAPAYRLRFAFSKPPGKVPSRRHAAITYNRLFRLMSYTVLARKYRPQKFSEVIGQEHVTRTLQNALEQGRTAHGYIFSGHRGIGKTTVARILAAALNCRLVRQTGRRALRHLRILHRDSCG